MDTPIIEVAIGLALVFALVSLVTTALQEAWTAMRGTRGEVLHDAIKSFVGDNEAFAQALLNHPLLVALSPQPVDKPDDRRPSYIGADAMVAALIAQLVQQHTHGQRPDTPAQLVEAVSSAAQKLTMPASTHGGAAPASALASSFSPPNPEFARGLASLVIGVERDWPAFEARLMAWYDAVGARSTGWFKRRVQWTTFVFGLLVAVALNINPIVIGSRLWGDKALRESVVAVAQKTLDAHNAAAGTSTAPQKPAPAPATPPAASSPTSSATSSAFRAEPAAAPSPAAPAPDTAALLKDLLGQLLQAGDLKDLHQADRDALHTALERFKLLRTATSTWQSASAADRPAAAANTLAAADNLVSAVPTALQAPVKDLRERLRAALQPPAQAPAPPKAAAPASSNVTLLMQGVCSIVEGAREAKAPHDTQASQDNEALCLQLHELNALQKAGLPIGWSPAARPAVFTERCATSDGNALSGGQCPGNKRDTWAWWGNSLLMLAGWLITALACTLGAPFWFDALGKLVKMRASGAKPDSTGPATPAPNAPPASLLSRSPAGTPGVNDSTDTTAPMSDALNDDEKKLTRAEIERLQRQLHMPETKVSGWFDGPTRDAIKAWQTSNTLTPNGGELSPDQITRLLAMA